MDLWRQQLHPTVHSLLLVLLFADMPFLSSSTPFYLTCRIDRKAWLLGQPVYIAAATTIYLVFILIVHGAGLHERIPSSATYGARRSGHFRVFGQG